MPLSSESARRIVKKVFDSNVDLHSMLFNYQDGRIDYKSFCFGLTTLGWSGSDKKMWEAMMEIGNGGEKAQYYPHCLATK